MVQVLAEGGWRNTLALGQTPENSPLAEGNGLLFELAPGNLRHQDATALDEEPESLLLLEQFQHHEHFGWVLVGCERADFRLSPDGVHVYGEEGYEFISVPPPRGGREAVIDALVGAIRFGETPVFDGDWGTITVACCEAILRSGAEHREIPVFSEPSSS